LPKNQKKKKTITLIIMKTLVMWGVDSERFSSRRGIKPFHQEHGF
jgi:hypothetical protein